MFSGPIEDIYSGVGPASQGLGVGADPIATSQLLLLANAPGINAPDAGNFTMPAGALSRDEQTVLMGDSRQRRVFVQRLFPRP